MAHDSGWRVIVFTNIAGGAVYRQVDEVVRALGHRVVGVVTSPGPPRRRNTDYLSVVAAVPPGVDVIVANHMGRLAAMIAPLRPDLIVCGGFTWRIPLEVSAVPRLGAINMHPSSLPRHRGPYALEWVFRSGDPALGFTIHRLDGDFDTGPILAQDSIPITDDDDYRSLLGKLFAIAPAILEEALERIARGESGDPQDESQATYAGAFEDAWRLIDWTQPARLIHNQVRSWTGMRGMPHGANAEIDGVPVTVTRTRLVPGPDATPTTPGTVLDRSRDGMTIQCGDGPITIIAMQGVESSPAE